ANGPDQSPRRAAVVGETLTVAVADAGLSVAVTVTVWVVVTDPAVAGNVTDVAPPATVTEPGTGKAVVLLDDSMTVLPLAGAACVSVTVPAVVAPDTTPGGLHPTDARPGVPPPPPAAGLNAAICAR